MFYCNNCAKENSWMYNTLTRSYGHCELCGEIGDCNDVPSKSLCKSPPELQDWGDPIVLLKVAEAMGLDDNDKRYMLAMSALNKTREQLELEVDEAIRRKRNK